MADKDPNQALKDRLAQRKQLVEQATVQGELDALPQNQTEGVLMQMQGTLRKMLPDTMSKEKSAKLINNTIQLIRQTPKLAMCGSTIMGGVLTAAQLGLELGVNALGEAYLLPFKKRANVNGKWVDTWEAQLIIGYKGYRKLAWQSGIIKEISRHIVWSNDDFRVQYGTNAGLHHIPSEDADRGVVRGYYATVSNINGGVMWTYMSLAEMEAHRDAYAMAKKKNYNSGDIEVVGPWKDNFNEMGLKTVLLKTLRDGPLSVEDKLGAAMYLDGSVRHNTTEVQDNTGLLNVAELTETFMANGVNVVEGETVDDEEDAPDEDEPVDVEPEPEPAPAPKTRTKAKAAPKDKPEPANQGLIDREFVAKWAQENNESLLDTLAAASGVVHKAPGDYTDEEIAVAANALRIPTQ